MKAWGSELASLTEEQLEEPHGEAASPHSCDLTSVSFLLPPVMVNDISPRAAPPDGCKSALVG